jgi:quercetin dioxygenase-like cupin family protein
MLRVLETNDGVQTTELSLAQGEASGPYANDQGSSTHVVIVIRGAVESRIEERNDRLIAGDCAIIPRGAKYRLVGASEKDAAMVLVNVPPVYDAGVIKPYKFWGRASEGNAR